MPDESPLEQLRAGVLTRDPQETRNWAQVLACFFPEDGTLALKGDLGVGKSTFVSGLARAWGIRQPTASPTFNLFHVYQGARCLLHFDAYRLESEAQMDALMLEDFLRSPYCLAVEWPERVASWLPEDAWWLELSISEPGVHRLRLLESDATSA